MSGLLPVRVEQLWYPSKSRPEESVDSMRFDRSLEISYEDLNSGEESREGIDVD
jgi:hypothetical protein